MLDRVKRLAEKSYRSGVRALAGRMIYGEEEREAFIHEVRHEIQGWNGTGALKLVHEIGKMQIDQGVRGDVAEIGVHHGQLFVFLMMLLRKGERGVALDLFEDQHLNVDGSGKGDRETLMTNLEKYCPQSKDQFTVVTGDSTKMAPGSVVQAGAQPVRIFSVDGGHTRDIVINDLFLAADALHDAGVVVLDDVFNCYFPGVGEGLAAYINGGADVSRFASYRNSQRRLLPFAIGCNKVLLAFEPHRAAYYEALKTSVIRTGISGSAMGWGVNAIHVFDM